MSIVLIVGASQGIGLAATENLGMNGHTVFAGYQGLKPSQELLKLSQKCDYIKTIPLDVTSYSSVKTAVESILRQKGVIDVVVNNAGQETRGPTVPDTVEEIADLFDINVNGLLRINHAVIPLMRENGQGKIIHISSKSCPKWSSNSSIYSVAKVAQDFIIAAIATELTHEGISVSILQTGPVGRFSQRDAINFRHIASGQSPHDVAKTIRQMVESKDHLWRQNSPNETATVDGHFKDTSGNSRVRLIPKL